MKKEILIDAEQLLGCYMFAKDKYSVKLKEFDEVFKYVEQAISKQAKAIIFYNEKEYFRLINKSTDIFEINKDKIQLQKDLDYADVQVAILENMDSFTKDLLISILKQYSAVNNKELSL